MESSCLRDKLLALTHFASRELEYMLVRHKKDKTSKKKELLYKPNDLKGPLDFFVLQSL